MKTSFWHLLPINSCALAQPILLIIFKRYGCVNDQTRLWKCWFPFPKMGICKEAVNRKYLAICAELKHIWKGHLCTRGNDTASTPELGTAAEVQLVRLSCDHSISFSWAVPLPGLAGQTAEPGTATKPKLNHEAASPSAARRGGTHLLSEAKRPNTSPVIKECSQYKT